MFMQFKALVAMSHSIEGVDKTAFLRGIPMLSMEDREFVERVFSLLDEDGSGIIEWQEFLLALTKLEHGTPMTRASFLFDVYDDDGGGTIEDEEMMHYFLASMRLTDETASDYFKDICKYFVSRVLSEIDPDHEGHLDRNRIVKFLQEHPDTTNVGGLFGRANVEVSATASVLQKNNIHLEQMLLSKDSHLPLEWTKAMHKEEKRRPLFDDGSMDWWKDLPGAHAAATVYNAAVVLDKASPARSAGLWRVLRQMPRMYPARLALAGFLADAGQGELVDSEKGRLLAEGVMLERAASPRSSTGLGVALTFHCVFVCQDATDATTADAARAIAECEEAVALMPDSLSARVALAKSLLNRQQWDRAARVLQGAVAQWPDSSTLACDLSIALLNVGRLNEAKEQLDRILAMPNPHPADYTAARRNMLALFALAASSPELADLAVAFAEKEARAEPLSLTRSNLLARFLRNQLSLGRVALEDEHSAHVARLWQKALATGDAPAVSQHAASELLANAKGREWGPLEMLAGLTGIITFDSMMLGPVLSAEQLRLLISGGFSLERRDVRTRFPVARQRQPDAPPSLRQATRGLHSRGPGLRSTTSGATAGPDSPLRVAYATYDLRQHPMGFMTAAVTAAHRRDRVEAIVVFYGPPNAPMRWGMTSNGVLPWQTSRAGTETETSTGQLSMGGSPFARIGGYFAAAPGSLADWRGGLTHRLMQLLEDRRRACRQNASFDAIVPGLGTELSLLGAAARLQSAGVSNGEPASWSQGLEGSTMAAARRWRASLATRFGLAARGSGRSPTSSMEEQCAMDRGKPWVTTTGVGARCTDSLVHAPASRGVVMAEPVDHGAEEIVLAAEFRAPLRHERALPAPPPGDAALQVAGAATEQTGAVTMDKPYPNLAAPQPDYCPFSALIGHKGHEGMAKGSLSSTLLAWSWEAAPSCEASGAKFGSTELTFAGDPVDASSPPTHVMPATVSDDAVVEALGKPASGGLSVGPAAGLPGAQAQAALRTVAAAGSEVFVDLMGYTTEVRNELRKQRPAPVNVQYLGFPGTTGTAYSDYMVSDTVVLPPERLYMHASARAGARAVREACASGKPAALLRASALLRADYPLATALRHCNGSAALEQLLPPGCAARLEEARRSAASIRASAAARPAAQLVWASKAMESLPAAGQTMGRWSSVPHPANVATEGLIVLPHVYQVHEKPLSVAACLVRNGPCVRWLRRHWGVPEDGVILGTIGSSARTLLTDLQAWAGVLRRSRPDSRLAVLGCSVGSQRCKAVRAVMGAQGVPPWRVLCVPGAARAAHVSRVGMLDLVLDSSSYNAHSTAAEVLAVGIPIATTRGQRFEARVGASLLRAAASGMPSSFGETLLETVSATLVHDSARAMQEAVTRLVARPESLWQLRRRLARASAYSPLHDSSGTTQAIERGYRAATDVRRAQVRGAFGSHSRRAVAPACGRVSAPPAASATGAGPRTVAPAASVQPGGWLPFHIVLPPLRGREADAQQHAAGLDRVSLLARAAYRHAIGWSMECDAAEMAHRVGSPAPMGSASSGIAGPIRVPVASASNAASRFLAAALRGERLGLRDPGSVPAAPCSVPPVAGDSMRGGASYNIEAARSLVNRWAISAAAAPIRHALSSWLHGVVWAAAELWHTRRAATLVAASWDGAEQAPSAAGVFAAGDTTAAGGPHRWEAQLRSSSASALIVTLLDPERLVRSAGDVWTSPAGAADGGQLEAISRCLTCSALQVRLSAPDGAGGPAAPGREGAAQFWVRDVGVGLWDTAAVLSNVEDPERAAAEEHGGKPLLPGVRAVMGAHKGSSAAGSSAWVPCSSSGCGEHAFAPQPPSGTRTGWRVTLAMLQAEHAALRASALTWLAQGTRKLRDLAAKALADAQMQLDERPAVLVVSQEAEHPSAAHCALSALQVAGSLVDSRRAADVIARAADAMRRQVLEQDLAQSGDPASAAGGSSRQLAGVQRKLSGMGVLFVAPARDGLASRALLSAADLDAEAVAVVTATLAARVAEQGAGLLAPTAREVRSALSELARSEDVRVTAVSLLELLSSLSELVLARVAQDQHRVAQATAAAVLCQVQAGLALAALSPSTVQAVAPGVTDRGVSAELALTGPTKLLYAANSLEASLTVAWRSRYKGASGEVDWVSAATYARLMQAVAVGYWRGAQASALKGDDAVVPLADRRFVPRPTDRPTVVLVAEEFGQGWFENWGPWFDQPVGGSEEAASQVIVALEALCRRHGDRMCVHVEVYKAVVPPEHRGRASAGAVWYPTAWLDPQQEWPPGGRGRTIAVLWRYPVSVGMLVGPAQVRDAARRLAQTHGELASTTGGDRAAALAAATGGRLGGVYAWLHDSLAPAQAVLARQACALFTGVFAISSYHSSTSGGETAIPDMFQVVRNGAATTLENPAEPVRREPGLVIYASAPNRGLRVLLHQWPRIRAAIPHARLEVFYGFTRGFHAYIQALMGEEAAGQWIAQTKQMLDQPGITLRGMVSSADLATAYRRASFFAYPTAFRETGCIALVKAMALGALPITSRFPESVLPELVGDVDLGPPLPAHLATLVDAGGAVRPEPEAAAAWSAVGPPYFESFNFSAAFGDAVIRSLRSEASPQMDAIRRQLRKRAAESLTWEAAARTMLQRWQADGLL
ncbi:hypothetical protein FNF29_05331 [Cafeteria roenbergensis]|uniref:EF-hand domain-containing protein n=1 Tax=Cafeteria roenbergensis TaxID=33653 RepID=A0A5A8CCD2_CAFRO|nr:hypothetical protein FNF29_05331 [Cafeteria roenbergensis]|eukprot:KAA0150319.1 hypothetical protein FNF29_05331 [Cafeteria roenbergensis]